MATIVVEVANMRAGDHAEVVYMGDLSGGRHAFSGEVWSRSNDDGEQLFVGNMVLAKRQAGGTALPLLSYIIIQRVTREVPDFPEAIGTRFKATLRPSQSHEERPNVEFIVAEKDYDRTRRFFTAGLHFKNHWWSEDDIMPESIEVLS